MVNFDAKKITLVIRGPLSDNAICEISNSISKSGLNFGGIVISSYVHEIEEYRLLIKPYENLNSATFSTVKDKINPGFYNINRQLHATASALAYVRTEYVIVMRNDQYVDFRKVLKYLCLVPDSKYLTVNTFTRRDRLYHPSDMFVAGRTSLVKLLFSMPLMPETHIQILRREQKKATENNYNSINNAPEQLIFRHFLTKNGWAIKNTMKDSESALKKYIFLCNSWDIELRLNKPRTYLMGRGAIILPHYFKIEPFPGGPMEKVRCWNSHQLNETSPSIKDVLYIGLSRVIWGIWPSNCSKTGRVVRRIRKILGLKI